MVWNYGEKFVNNNYKGGLIADQLVDPDKLGYWCLLAHAREELKLEGNFKLYFKMADNEGLELLDDDKSTCKMLCVLNDKKK